MWEQGLLGLLLRWPRQGLLFFPGRLRPCRCLEVRQWWQELKLYVSMQQRAQGESRGKPLGVWVVHKLDWGHILKAFSLITLLCNYEVGRSQRDPCPGSQTLLCESCLRFQLQSQLPPPSHTHFPRTVLWESRKFRCWDTWF